MTKIRTKQSRFKIQYVQMETIGRKPEKLHLEIENRTYAADIYMRS